MTILETLISAKKGISDFYGDNYNQIIDGMTRRQIVDAITLLEKSYKLDTDIDILLNSYKIIEDVPVNQPCKSCDCPSFIDSWEKKMNQFTKEELIQWIRNNLIL